MTDKDTMTLDDFDEAIDALRIHPVKSPDDVSNNVAISRVRSLLLNNRDSLEKGMAGTLRFRIFQFPDDSKYWCIMENADGKGILKPDQHTFLYCEGSFIKQVLKNEAIKYAGLHNQAAKFVGDDDEK